MCSTHVPIVQRSPSSHSALNSQTLLGNLQAEKLTMIGVRELHSSIETDASEIVKPRLSEATMQMPSRDMVSPPAFADAIALRIRGIPKSPMKCTFSLAISPLRNNTKVVG